jgi:(S)-ureidoglycine aminohydrolase
MKTLLLMLAMCSKSALVAQENAVRSDVYRWNDLKVEKEASRERRPILKGSTTDLAHLEIHASTLAPGKAPHPAHTHEDEEELVIVKEGQLKVTINEESKVLGPGSIALIVPGEAHGFENAGDTQASYYILKYRSKLPMDKKRGEEAGGSLMIDWNDLEFHPHDKGGIRRYFDRPTAMCKNFEMHVTTLNEGLKSHEPHTHRAAEIVLVIEGNTEMQIGDKFYQGTQGDLYFLASEIPHAIRNTGEEPCVYFAFQWE